MDNLVLEFRDPIVSIIFFFFLIFLISFITYSYGLFKERKSRKEYRKLSKRFELGKLKENDYVNLYKTYNLPFDSILLLANTFLHKGDLNKAISVYLALLEVVKDRVKEEELLEVLGTTYLKGGFLQRSNDIFLKILKFSPRNKNALKNLILVNEKMKNYTRAREICNSLEELNIDLSLEKVYFDAMITLNDPVLTNEKRTKILYNLFLENRILQRIFVSFIIVYNKEFFYKHIKEFDHKEFIDILWFLQKDDIDFNKIENISFLQELYSAKGYLNSVNSSSDFDLDVLILIKNHKKEQGNLSFKFICSSCKESHPFFETRCPNCHSVLSLNVKHQLVKSFANLNQSLQ
ncbi:tetratricopeptide repeat protein [Arcobacter porcinus]|uniref:Uncharacterized protein n=1 Tax=Arcobacter porcinus TaxID=1935204 RepID=A0A5C2HGA7_9BACT|nr:hypothetical protein [Arcobacter porcinus]OCL96576.1 tetratricopeptide repeat protein [Aliarcobacter thereius]QEP41174.1 hypothetical protein APORC_1602 [Arcobacter porcinus]